MQNKMKSRVGGYGLILAFLLSCPVQAENQQRAVSPQGTDCTQIKALLPQASSGVYVIQPAGVKTPFKRDGREVWIESSSLAVKAGVVTVHLQIFVDVKVLNLNDLVQVYCEMRSDGGWTVFQKRSGGLVSFNRKWAAYKNGFGCLTQDHWLGLQKVFCLTKNKTKRWSMRVDLWDHESGTAFAEYRNFRLGNEKTAFRLHVGTYSGNAGDAIRGAYPGIDQNGYGFSTIDRDNDGCSPCIFGDIAQRECTSSEGGGWWYSRCGSASLNGDWHPAGDHIGWASGLHWQTWKTHAPYSAKATRMMIKSL